LVSRGVVNTQVGDETYNTPMLMAISAPILSFLLIVTIQMIFHGRNARTVSKTPEYTAA
jgi:hypothetical protein